MINSLDVYRPGEPVLVGSGADTFVANVLSVKIQSADRVAYELVWWNGRERKIAEVESWEVKPAHAPKRTLPMRIGFGNGN